MSSLDMVHSAQADVAKIQTTLSAVQSGLGTVETAVETAQEARRGMRRMVKIGLVLIIVAIVVAVVKSRQREEDLEG